METAKTEEKAKTLPEDEWNEVSGWADEADFYQIEWVEKE